MSSSPAGVVPRRGRPRKFSRPSRAVTLTLPEDVIAALTAIDRDLSRAVVRVAQPVLAKLPTSPAPTPAAELARFGHSAVIVVERTPALEQRVGVTLVPLSDGRALIAFDETMTPARLELKIQDALEDAALPDRDARIFTAIGDLLKDARRSSRIALRQQNIIVLEDRGRRPRRSRAVLSPR
jgi:hypothetical protein